MAEHLTDRETGVSIRPIDQWDPSHDDAFDGTYLVPQFAMRVSAYSWWHWRRWLELIGG